jgi:Flp pilus assembly protein TadG
VSWTNVAVPFTVTATDLCSSATVVCDPPSGSLFLFNTTNTIHCVARDGCGNSNTCDFTVTIQRPTDLGNLYLAFDGTNITLTWTTPGILQQSDSMLGPWTDVPVAPPSPYVFAPDPSSPPVFFRLRSN